MEELEMVLLEGEEKMDKAIVAYERELQYVLEELLRAF